MAKKNPYLNDRDILDQALEHSWGKTADAKAKEKAYNREYYQRHKEEILRKARQAGEGIQRTAQNAYDDVKTAFSKDRRGSSSVDPTKTNKTSEMNSRLRNEGRARYNEAARNADELSRYERNYRQGRAHNPTYTREYNNYIGREANRAMDESNRAYKNASRMAKRASSSGAAANEASKASQQQGYEKRFDSKLARDVQNAYSKLRNPKEMARRAGESAKNAYDQAKLYVGTATNPTGRHPGEHAPTYNDVERYRNANIMNKRLYNEAKDRTAQSKVNERKADARFDRLNNATNANYAKAESEFNRSRELSNNPNTKGLASDAKGDAVKYQSRAREFQELSYDVARQSLDAKRNVGRAKNNQSRMAKRRAASGTALNEAEKANRASWRGAYNVRYDTKLARDAQNARAKARDIKNNPGKYVNKAKDSVDQFVNNALSKAKKKKKS